MDCSQASELEDVPGTIQIKKILHLAIVFTNGWICSPAMPRSCLSVRSRKDKVQSSTPSDIPLPGVGSVG
jgi:hypothetical protein